MGLNKMMNHVVQANNKVGDEAKSHRDDALVLFVVLVLQMLLNALVGQWIWNNSVVKLVSGVSKARWYDTLLLSVLFLLILPN
jgi:hypothetical protein